MDVTLEKNLHEAKAALDAVLREAALADAKVQSSQQHVDVCTVSTQMASQQKVAIMKTLKELNERCTRIESHHSTIFAAFKSAEQAELVAEKKVKDASAQVGLDSKTYDSASQTYKRAMSAMENYDFKSLQRDVDEAKRLLDKAEMDVKSSSEALNKVTSLEDTIRSHDAKQTEIANVQAAISDAKQTLADLKEKVDTITRDVDTAQSNIITIEEAIKVVQETLQANPDDEAAKLTLSEAEISIREAVTTLQEAQRKLEEVKIAYANAQADLDEKTATLTKLQEEIELGDMDRAALVEIRKLYDDAHSDFIRNTAELAKAQEAYTQAVSTLNNKKKQLEEEASLAYLALQQAQAVLDASSQQVQDATRAYEATRSVTEDVVNQFDIVNNDLKAAKIEIDRSKKELVDADLSFANAQKALELAKSELAKAKLHSDAMAKKVLTSKAAVEAATSAIDEYNTKGTEKVADIVGQLQQAESVRTIIAQLLDQQKQDTLEYARLREQIKTLTNNTVASESEIAAHTARLKELTSSIAAAEQSLAHSQEIVQNAVIASVEVAKQRQLLDTLRTNATTLIKLLDEKEALEAKLVTHTATLKQTEQQLVTTKSHLTTQQTLFDLTRNLIEAVGEVTQTADPSKLTKSIAHISGILSKLDSETKERKQDLIGLRGILEPLQTKVGTYTKLLTDLRTQRNNEEIKLVRLEQEKKTALQAEEAATSMYADCITEIAMLKKKITELSKDQGTSVNRDHVEALQIRLRDTEHNAILAQSHLERVQERIANVTREYLQLEKHVASRVRDLDDIVTNLINTQSESNDLLSAINDREETVSALEQTLRLKKADDVAIVPLRYVRLLNVLLSQFSVKSHRVIDTESRYFTSREVKRNVFRYRGRDTEDSVQMSHCVPIGGSHVQAVWITRFIPRRSLDVGTEIVRQPAP